MNFNNHSNLVGQHAFLGASKYHWLNYDATKIAEAYRAAQAVQMGTRLHAFAAECIDLRQRLPKSRKTLNMYVNDAIGYNLKPEQVLYYSQNCFGTADAIDMRGDLLRIHDLKTGKVPAHMEQLMIYAALFCLEYGILIWNFVSIRMTILLRSSRKPMILRLLPRKLSRPTRL